MFAKFKRILAENKTKNELGALSNRALKDIGVSRSEIPYIAHEGAMDRYNKVLSDRLVINTTPTHQFFGILERPL